MTENPYESIDAEQSATSNPIVGIGCTVIAVILVILLMLAPFSRGTGVPEAARRNGCTNNVRQITLAIINYEAATGKFPPAYTVDDQGNRLHSWRTLILPYIEEIALYETIDLTKPWDDPANANAREAVISLYECPSSSHGPGRTTYLAIVGPDKAFAGSTPRSISEIKDGTSKTAAIIDVGSDQAVHWMSPHDADEQMVLGFSSDSDLSHKGSVITTFLDGHVISLPLSTTPEQRRAIMTIAGSEEVNEQDF